MIVAPPTYEEAIAPQRMRTPEPPCFGQDETALVSDVTTTREVSNEIRNRTYVHLHFRNLLSLNNKRLLPINHRRQW